MLTSVLAENGSKKEMLERKCVFFWQPNFRIQMVNYVVISISNSSLSSTLEQQKSDKVCAFKVRLSAFEVSQLSSEFFCSNSRCSSWRLPVWNTTSYYKRGTFSFIALCEVPFAPGLFYVKCTLPLTRQTDNFVMIMASNHPSLAMLYIHLFLAKRGL